MAKLPWKTVHPVEPATEATVMASRLPLQHYRHIPSFLWSTVKIRRQLAGTEGLIGYALDAELTKKTFWTVSAWTDTERLRGFDRADPHHRATVRIRPRMRPSTFVFWKAKADELPIAWADVRRRVEERAQPGS